MNFNFKDFSVRCNFCNATGTLQSSKNNDNEVPCPNCHGIGFLDHSICIDFADMMCLLSFIESVYSNIDNKDFDNTIFQKSICVIPIDKKTSLLIPRLIDILKHLPFSN